MGFLSTPITLQTLFGTKRMIGPITAQCVVSEDTSDTLTITKQPVQIGSSITDHAYQEPTVLTMVILQQNNALNAVLSTFSGGGLAALYQQFLTLQSSAQPFNILTPKRTYKNMLINTIRMNTDKNTENILSLSLSFQQVILVSVGQTIVPAANQSNAAVTQGTQNIGNQSALYTTFGGP